MLAALSRRRSRVQVPSGPQHPRPGSSVGTSVRLKIGRSAVRPRPWPPGSSPGTEHRPPAETLGGRFAVQGLQRHHRPYCAASRGLHLLVLSDPALASEPLRHSSRDPGAVAGHARSGAAQERGHPSDDPGRRRRPAPSRSHGSAATNASVAPGTLACSGITCVRMTEVFAVAASAVETGSAVGRG